jgi:hypothetical protein
MRFPARRLREPDFLGDLGDGKTGVVLQKGQNFAVDGIEHGDLLGAGYAPVLGAQHNRRKAMELLIRGIFISF